MSMQDRVVEGLGHVIDRPVPRAALSVLAIGLLEGGLYGGHALFDETLAERQADIAACVGQLDPGSNQVGAAKLPDACEPFRTSFSYRDTTVTVVDRGGDVQPSHTRHRTLYLPGQADFRRTQGADAIRDYGGKSGGGDTLQVGAGFLGVGGIFTVLSMIAGDRRKNRAREAKRFADIRASS